MMTLPMLSSNNACFVSSKFLIFAAIESYQVILPMKAGDALDKSRCLIPFWWSNNPGQACRQTRFIEGEITPKKSLGTPMRNQKSRTPKPEIPWKNEKSRMLNVEVIYPSRFIRDGNCFVPTWGLDHIFCIFLRPLKKLDLFFIQLHSSAELFV